LDMFYNTGIATYIWILTNRKRKERRGKVQLINAVDLFVRMRKNLGHKRSELSSGNIAEIVELYGDVTRNGRSKVFDNEDFGYRQITVERPLRLAFQVTSERIEAFKLEAAFQKLASSKKKGKQGQQEIEEGQKTQAEILAMLEGMAGPKVDLNRPDFEKRLEKAAGKAEVKLSAPVKKAILNIMSERDEGAEICLDEDGDPEADAELRDYENVPLKEDIHAFFEREVKPHVADAWIDESKTKLGYELPFNRHFYKYTSPRPLEEIKAEIKTTEQDILRLLAEVAG
jgi:type I restriction enzyme M protein